MANCPKCGYHLKLTDWRPNCPKCGVNLVYYGMEERLLADADKAEAEHARFQKRIDRLKASFIGSKLTIVRIILSILPIAALMLPLGKLTFSGPFIEQTTENINAITIYNVVSSLDFGGLITMLGAPITGQSFLMYAISLVTLLLSLVVVIVSLVLLTLACSKKGNPRNLILNSVALVCAVVSVITYSLFTGNINAVFPDFISGSLGFGAFVYLATLVALLTINIIIAKKGVAVKYKQCYIGGIPSEEYFAMLDSGESQESIRAKMTEALEKQDAEEAAKRAEDEAKKAQEETERLKAALEKSKADAEKEEVKK